MVSTKASLAVIWVAFSRHKGSSLPAAALFRQIKKVSIIAFYKKRLLRYFKIQSTQILSNFKKKRGSFFFENLRNDFKSIESLFPTTKAQHFRPTHFFVKKIKEIVSALIGKQCLNSI